MNTATATVYEVRDAGGLVLARAERVEKQEGPTWVVRVLPGSTRPSWIADAIRTKATTDGDAKVVAERAGAAVEAWFAARLEGDSRLRQAVDFACTAGVGQGELL